MKNLGSIVLPGLLLKQEYKNDPKTYTRPMVSFMLQMARVATAIRAIMRFSLTASEKIFILYLVVDAYRRLHVTYNRQNRLECQALFCLGAGYVYY